MNTTKVLAKQTNKQKTSKQIKKKHFKPDYKPIRGYLACYKLSPGIHEQLYRKLKLTATTPLGFQFVSTKL